MAKKNKSGLKRQRKRRAPPIEEAFTEDGILSSIISWLPLDEAVRTSVLSRRWRDMWAYMPILVFDIPSMFDAQTLDTLSFDGSHLDRDERYWLEQRKRELFVRKADHFMQLVDSVLQKYKGSRLDELVVRYPLSRRCSHHVDEWVKFAASKAKKLVLDLAHPLRKYELEVMVDIDNGGYIFPCHLLGPTSTIEILSLAYCNLEMPRQYDCFSNLKVLCLYDTYYVSQEDVHRLLCNCPALQKFAVCKSHQLVSLNIPRHLSQLQCLIVKECKRLTEIKIEALNLHSLHYKGVPLDFSPIPSQLKRAKAETNAEFCLAKISINLQSLGFSGVPKMDGLPKDSNIFTHLKRVDWEWNDSSKMSIYQLDTLLHSTPFLEEFKLCLTTRVAEQPPPPKLGDLWEMLPKHPRSHLKTIEICGFYFDEWQIKVALYLLKGATKLRSMMIQKGRNCCPEINEVDVNNIKRRVPRNARFAFVILEDYVKKPFER